MTLLWCMILISRAELVGAQRHFAHCFEVERWAVPRQAECWSTKLVAPNLEHQDGQPAASLNTNTDVSGRLLWSKPSMLKYSNFTMPANFREW